MRNLGWAWLVLVVVVAGLLIVPASREVIRIEGSALCPYSALHRLYPTGAPAEEMPAPEMNRFAASAEAQNPKDWRLVLGAALLTSDEKEESRRLEKAVQLAPDRPESLTALAIAQLKDLQWDRKEDYGYDYKLEPGYKEKLLTPEQVKPVRETLERLQTIDPDNAAPKVLLAALNFGEKRDAETLALLKIAVTEPKLNFYDLAMIQARERALKVAGLPSFEATTTAFSGMLFYHFARLRQLARNVSYKGMEAKEAGHDQEAIEDWMATLRFGRMLRNQASTYIEALVGNAIEAIGAAPVYKWNRMGIAAQKGLKPVSELAGKEGRYNGGDIFPGEYHDFFLKTAGPAAAADILAGLEQGQEFKLRSRSRTEEITDTFLAAISLLRPGAVMLGQIVILAALLILLTLLPWGKSRAALHKFWAVVISLVALAPVVALWVHASLAKESSFGEYEKALIAPERNPAYNAGLWLVPGLVVIVILALVLRLRRSNEDSVGLILLRLLRQVATSSLILLLFAYAGLVVQTSWLRGKTTAAMEEKINRGEMAQMRADYPQFFAEPGSIEKK